jgi:hypothetical protein
MIMLEDSIVTGGFYLSTHMLHDSLYGHIHSFILPSLLTKGENPAFSTFICRIVHYLHTSFVLNDPGKEDHLLELCTMDGVRDLFLLFVITMFLNVFDDQTYQFPSVLANQPQDILQKIQDLFDLSAIPVNKRHHFCYARGLIFDLVFWFFNHYSFSNSDHFDDEIDGCRDVLDYVICHMTLGSIRWHPT